MADRFAATAPIYEHLFPARPAQIDFLLAARPEETREIFVDLGCATGTHLEVLADRGLEVFGIDLAASVIARIAERRPDLAGRARQGDMRSVDRVLRDVLPGKPGLVYSIGNSFALLGGRPEISDTLEAVRRMIDEKGAMAIQVVNFDAVLAAGGLTPPLIERELKDGRRVVVGRQFTPEGEDLVRFRFSLTLDGERKDTESLHLALRRHEFETLLPAAGFGEMEFFGDFDRSPWSPSAPATIVVAR